MNIKRSFEGRIFSTNHIHRAKNNNIKNSSDINLVSKEILYHHIASFKTDPFHESGRISKTVQNKMNIQRARAKGKY
jgi:hypothetical protein